MKGRGIVVHLSFLRSTLCFFHIIISTITLIFVFWFFFFCVARTSNITHAFSLSFGGRGGWLKLERVISNYSYVVYIVLWCSAVLNFDLVIEIYFF